RIEVAGLQLGRGRLLRVRRGRRTGRLPEDERLHERVPAEAVRPMDGDAGGLAGGVQAGDVRLPRDVRADAPHHVVLGWGDGDRVGHRVHPGERPAEVTDLLKPALDLLLPEVHQLEVDVRA